MKTANRISAVLIILLSIFMICQTSQIQDLAFYLISNKMFPYITFASVLALGVGLLATTFIPSLDPPFPSGYWQRVIGRKRLITLTLFCLYLMVIPLAGFLLSSAGFIVVTIAVLSPRVRQDLPVALVVAAGIVGLIYLVFVYWLQTFLP
ncbi:MAG: tripartite tricarboxylate transporter TctB family protein [Rhodospirillaceae bacterium]|nr:tripartite tricarboxylate transporter TctB family protein [Rhodospirillaceae bacterium]